MATNRIYACPGAVTMFAASGVAGQNVLWTPQNEATARGRISSVWDRGAGAKPLRYAWRMRTKWASTPTAGDAMRLYLVQADAAADTSQTDGGQVFGDAELTVEIHLYQSATFLGTVISNGNFHNESSCGLCQIFCRYCGIAMWNAAASKALTDVATDQIFTLTELPDEVEAAS